MQMVKHYNKQESHNSLRETKALPPWLSIIIIAAMIVEHDVATYKKRISDYLLEDVERGDTDRWWIVVLFIDVHQSVEAVSTTLPMHFR